MFFFNIIKKNKLIFFFLLICFIYNSVQIYQFANDKYAYQYGDWLINYSNGFVRRGLGGEIIYYFSYFFKKNIQISYFVILFILLTIFYYKSFTFINKISFNFFVKILFFSPFLYLFFTLNHKAGVRKEILLYIYFIFLLSSLCKKNIKNINWKYIFFFPILLLIHEGLFFFLPFIILVFLSVIDLKNYKKIFFQLITFILLTSCIQLLVIFFKGDANSINVICDSLKQYAYQNCKNTGAISWLALDFKIYINQTLNVHDTKGYFYWLINIIYGFFPLLIIFFSNNFVFNKKIYLLNFLNIRKINLCIIFLIILILFLFPLFLVAIDWGRWLSIVYHLFFFIIIFFIEKKIIISKKNNFFSRIAKFFETYNKIFLLIIFIYSHFLIPGVFYIKDVNKFMSLNFAYVSLYNNFMKTFLKYR
jgi:hypothetical protein